MSYLLPEQPGDGFPGDLVVVVDPGPGTAGIS